MDGKIIEAANALIKAINESGRKMTFEKDGELIMPVSLNIYVYNHYEPERLVVKSYHHDWEVHGDYTE